MRRDWLVGAVLLPLCGACGDDDTGKVQDLGGLDAQATAYDGGQAAPSDASPVDGSVSSVTPEAGSASDAGTNGDASADAASSGPNADAPPSTQGGKKLYAVRFDARAGDNPFACGKPAALGKAATMVEPVDLRFFVHDVTLVRASGERVPLALYQDERWQRDNVALLDFVDDTGKCLTGDRALRTVVYGYADEHADYASVAFKIGIPPDKNHLDGAHAPAPYSASGLWWSWSGGYKYMRLDLTSAAQPIWYFHAGATGCSGMVASGFQCGATQIPSIELPDYNPETSIVVFDAAKFYANSDLSVAADGLPGCMGEKDDTECAPLYNALGVVPWDDSARTTQTAFVLRTGSRFTPPTSTGSGPPSKNPRDPVAWPDPDYQRPPALNVPNVSKAGETRSHPPDDPRYNVNCMRCHQDKGPGIGMFTAAGTLVDSLGKPASTSKVELFSGTVVGYGMFDDIVSQAILEVDGNGNFFTTVPLPLDTTNVSARVLNAAGQVVMTMPFDQQTAACNNCHTGGFRLTLPAPAAMP